MVTNAQSGNNFLLKVADKYNGSTYTTVAALRTTSLVINKSSVDVTTKSSNGWQELLPGGGVKSIQISAEGVYSDDLTQQLLLNAIIGKIKATGSVVFGTNPSNNDNFIFNGITWTFVTSGASGNQTNIGASLSATLNQLAIDLNASPNTSLNVATYTSDNVDTLNIEYDVIGSIGNTYTLADGTQGAANTTPSSSTLTGGMDQDQNWNMKLIDEAGHTWTGSFQVENFTFNGDSNAEESFSITLNSADEITYI